MLRLALCVGALLVMLIVPPASAAPATFRVLVAAENTADCPTLGTCLTLTSAHRANLARAQAFWNAASHDTIRMTLTYATPIRLRSCSGVCTEAQLCARSSGPAVTRLIRAALNSPTGRGQSWDAVVAIVRPSGRQQPACPPTSIYMGRLSGAGMIVMWADLLASPAGLVTVTHELGHALGLAHGHSAALPAPGDPPRQIAEYGDSWSIMGGSSLYAPPAPAQVTLGWIAPPIRLDSRPIRLAPLSAADGIRAVVIDRDGSLLWLENRLDSDGPLGGGVGLHADGPAGEYIATWLIAFPLQPGASWTDPYTGSILHIGPRQADGSLDVRLIP